MHRSLPALFFLMLFFYGCAAPVPLVDRAQGLLDEARWTVETFKQMREPPWDIFDEMLAEAQGVVILPGVVKVGFLLAAEGGNGVLVARDGAGNWGYPAFYTMGGGSIGLQAGGQFSEMILVLRNRGAVESLIEHQGKLGADMEVTVGVIGAGMEGAVTTNLGADIVVFSQAIGLYGGVSVEGSVLARRIDYNEAFYGAGATPRAIVIEGKYSNPKADPLREALVTR